MPVCQSFLNRLYVCDAGNVEAVLGMADVWPREATIEQILLADCAPLWRRWPIRVPRWLHDPIEIAEVLTGTRGVSAIGQLVVRVWWRLCLRWKRSHLTWSPGGGLRLVCDDFCPIISRGLRGSAVVFLETRRHSGGRWHRRRGRPSRSTRPSGGTIIQKRTLVRATALAAWAWVGRFSYALSAQAPPRVAW